MCGFLTILGTNLHKVSKKRLLDSIAHRGPDAAGEWQEEVSTWGIAGFPSLTCTGDQPMESWDGRYVIVFNGEIYNFLELRDFLGASGAKFRTRSDTEVILEAYREWGPEVVDHLHGMFAFVIWDRHRRSAFGARDRIGIKPLCWASLPRSLVLASTLEPFSLIEMFR